jgi:excisionase family DNA binding protein
MSTVYLTIKDLAKELQVKPSTLYAWVAEGKIPCIKLHRLIRFRRDQIEEWVEGLGKPNAKGVRLSFKRDGVTSIDKLIAAAKADVYTPACGKPDQDRAKGKEVRDGSV